MRQHVTQVKPPAVGLQPALRRDRFIFSSATLTDSKCCTEALHIARHDDLSSTNVSSSFGSILPAFRLCFSMSLYLFRCPPRERAPCSSWLYCRKLASAAGSHSCVWRARSSEVELIIIRKASMPDTLQISRTSVFGMWSCHLTWAIRRRQRMWNCSNFATCRGMTLNWFQQ